MDTGVTIGLYVIVALGAVGLFLVLPRSRASFQMAGYVFLTAALAGLLFVLARGLVGQGVIAFYFLVFAALALIASVRVITHRKPVYSALYFILVILAVVGLLLLQEAEFLAIALAIIYAGAILVTYLFVIMLAQQSGETEYDTKSRAPFGAVAVGFMLIAAVTGQIGELAALGQKGAVNETELVAMTAAVGKGETKSSASSSASNEEGAVKPGPTEPETVVPGNTDQIGALLLTRYMPAMQLAGVLLLVAMVGAIVLAKKMVPEEAGRAGRSAERPLGEVGRKISPF